MNASDSPAHGRSAGVRKVRLMGNPRRMPSMAGYGLEITGYLSKDSLKN